jgi:exo-beta-1,3-glucanase (GH17 family)
MTVTLATPPSGPNEQIDTVDVSLYCDGVDPVLGVPRPPQSAPETFSINVATSQGPEPKNTIGLFEKQGLPAGNCYFSFAAASNTGNTQCTGELTVAVATNETTDGTVVLACIHTPRYGGVRGDGTFNQCAEYRQILVTPTTQAIGNLVDVATQVYDPDGDPVTVGVKAVGACSNVMFTNGDTAASCETVSGCETVSNTVECTDVGLCQIIVAVSDDGFTSCNGLLPDGSNNDGARSTIDVDCTVAQGCGNGQIDPGEDCDPPDGVFCDDNCQAIDNCSPDPCNQGNVCSPEVCSADANNQPVCTPDPGSAAGNACSPPNGGACDGQGNCVACTQDADCEDNNACTDNACVSGACEFTNNDNNQCTTGGFPGTCNAGDCEGLCAPDTCTSSVECVTEVCDPANGSCTPQNSGINTGCDLGGSDGVCDADGTCVQCNMDSQCASGESCVNNACEAPPAPACLYAQDFESLTPAPQTVQPTSLATDGWLVGANVFGPDGTSFLYNYFAFPAPNGGPAFSAVAVGEGGPDQGARQLSIYNDYNNGDHANGNIIEAIVFRERTIEASDVGTTIVFTFDAKRGNINSPTDPKCIPGDPLASPNLPCDTTASAFLKTIDTSAGGATTNALFEDMTNLPDAWGTFTISLPIVQELLGQVLQIGFQSRATDFEPSGIFYDNITLGPEGCGGDGGPGIELRPLPEIYTTGNAINYSPYRAQGPEVQPPEMPSDDDILEDLGLLQTAGYNLLRLFGGDAVSERILQLAAANFPEMRFQQGLFLEGLAPGPAQQNCDSALNDSQVATAIRLANTYSSVVTVSVGNETSFFGGFMPLNCLEGYITETRDSVAQPVTADDDYTFYANFFGRSPDGVLRLIDFVSIHTYPFLNYQQWDWKQEGVPAGLLRAEAMMNASLAKAQDNYQAVYNYLYRDASGRTVTVGGTLPIVVGETGWKWRQTTPSQEIEAYAALPVNAKWYNDLMLSWERSPGGPITIFPFEAFDEAWKTTDDGWGFWDELRMPNYVLCGTPADSACNEPLYEGAGYYSP